MRFYSCDNKDFCLPGYDAMQFDEWGQASCKGQREKQSLILGSKELKSADVSQVANPYKITM